MDNTPAIINQNDSSMPVAALSASETAAIAMAAKQRALVEAKYKMALARPRDLDLVRQKMLKDASRPSFAAVAIYHKPVGNGVEGPSIRFVEAAIRNMTNINVYTSTISEDEERRVIGVYAEDLESNTSYSQEITVTKTVERKKLPAGEKPIRVRTNTYGQMVYIIYGSDDDILNKQNALISKAVRTLGLRLIPGDLVDEAIYYVRKTMATEDAQNPDAAKNRIIDAFSQLGVSVESLKDYLGHELSSIDPNELQTLRALYSAIKDGETTWKSVMDDKAERESKSKEQPKAAPKQATAKKQATKQAPAAEPEHETAQEQESSDDNDMFG